MKKIRMLFVLLIMMLLPTSAHAGIEGRYDSTKWISDDTIGLHFTVYVTESDDMYLLKGIKYHLEVTDSETKKIVVNDDVECLFSDLNADPLVAVPSNSPGFTTNYGGPDLKKCNKISTKVTNIIPIAEYVPDYMRSRIMRGIYIN